MEIGGVAYDKLRSYSLNSYLAWQQPEGSFNADAYRNFVKSSDLATSNPSQILAFVDTSPGNLCHPAFVIYLGTSRRGNFYMLPGAGHQKSGVLSFTDGHVEGHKWESSKTVDLALSPWNANHLGQYLFEDPDGHDNPDWLWLRDHASALK